MVSLSFSPVKMRPRHSQIRVDLVLVKGLSVRENMNQIYTSSVPGLRIALVVKIVNFTRAYTQKTVELRKDCLSA